MLDLMKVSGELGHEVVGHLEEANGLGLCGGIALLPHVVYLHIKCFPS